MRPAYATIDVTEQLDALFPWYAFHHHLIAALVELDVVDYVILLRLMIGCIQSYTASCSGLSIAMTSCPITILLDSAALTEGLGNFSTMTSSGVGALEEEIHTM
jgi:hypothetical protein